MNQDVNALLARSLSGQLEITKMHAGDITAGVEHMVALMEKEKRGLRFLPRQAVKRAMRDFQHSGLRAQS